MPVDFTCDLKHALKDPEVRAALGAAVAEHCRSLVLSVLAEHQADAYLTAQQAAKYLYGSDDKVEAFRKLRLRHRQLDRCSVGRLKLRRWKRADLDAFLATNPRFKRYADGSDFA